MKEIKGGVCAATGFKAASIHCGIKKGNLNDDLAVIVSDCECTAAATYTLNRVKAAPLYVTMEHLENKLAKAIIANSGNANACAPDGSENANRMCKALSSVLNIEEKDIVVASTGVIGQRINIECIEENVPKIKDILSENGSDMAANAIMTTDTKMKSFAVEVEIGGKLCHIGGIAKGSGMIHPNMGTMLSFVTTDCAITGEMLNEALTKSVKKTYNRVSVDGDTSTNDMCVVLANGKAENELIDWKDDNYNTFYEALNFVNTNIAKMIAGDGEGATKLITCTVRNSRSEETAERIAKSVAASSLVKTAMFGADANWGRVLCAMGYSKAPFRPEYVEVRFKSNEGEILVCNEGAGVDFNEDLAKKILLENEVIIDINVNEGEHDVTAWGCDLTYEYVKINGEYRT